MFLLDSVQVPRGHVPHSFQPEFFKFYRAQPLRVQHGKPPHSLRGRLLLSDNRMRPFDWPYVSIQ